MDEVMIALEAVADQIESQAAERVGGVAFAELDPRDIVVETVDGDEDDLGHVFYEWDEIVWDRRVEIEDLVSCSKEPRGGMLTYNYTLVAVPLVSKRRLYLEWGDMTELQAVGVAAADAPESADLYLIQHRGPGDVDIPFSVAGDLLFRIDVLWTEAAREGFVFDALTDYEADWMDDSLLRRGDARRAAAEQALEEAVEEGELSEEQAEAESSDLAASPPWFLTLSKTQLDRVAKLPVPAADRTPPLRHSFAPWRRPTGEIFRRPTDPVNLQHIAAAWVVGGFS